MTTPSNIASIEKTTSRSWDDWLAFFTRIRAETLDHPTIAKHVYDQLISIEDINTSWWAQSITVAYEQHIGRRVPGQSGEGDFQVSVSRTLNGSVDDVMTRWIDLADSMHEFNGHAIIDAPRRTATNKWRHWRVNLSDYTLITASVQQKSHDKSILTVSHTKLASKEAASAWREYWKELLRRL